MKKTLPIVLFLCAAFFLAMPAYARKDVTLRICFNQSYLYNIREVCLKSFTCNVRDDEYKKIIERKEISFTRCNGVYFDVQPKERSSCDIRVSFYDVAIDPVLHWNGYVFDNFPTCENLAKKAYMEILD